MGLYRIGSTPHWLQPRKLGLSLDGALSREHPTPHPGSTFLLTVFEGHGQAGPKSMRLEEQVVPSFIPCGGMGRER